MSYTRNVLLTYITQVLQVIFRLAGGIIAARVLGPPLLGVFALIQMVAGTAANLGNLGVGNSIIYFAGKYREKTHQLASNAVLLGLLQGIFLLLLAAILLPLLQPHLKGFEDATWLLWALALAAIPFRLLIINFNSLLRAQNRIGLFNLNNFLIASVNFLCIFLFLVPLSLGLPGRVIAFTLGTVVGAAITFRGIKSLFQKGFRPEFPLARNMLQFGSIIHATTIIQFLNYRLDIFLLGFFCSSGVVGQYFVAVTLGEMLWYLPNSIGLVLFPILTGGRGNGSRLTSVSARNNLFLITLLSLLVFAGAEIIIKLFFSADYLPAVRPLQVLLPGIIGFSLAKIISPDLISRGMPRVVAVISLASLVLNIALNLILIPLYQATGAALASTTSYLAGIIMLLHVYRKVSGHGWKEILLVNRQDLRGYKNFAAGALRNAYSYLQNNKTRLIKRSMDITLSLFLLLVLSPLMLVIALAVFMESGRAAIFIQERAGLGGKPFKIYKFRSMAQDKTPRHQEDLQQEAERITRVGKILRAASLDELPQLINVLKGNMSLVGPRPTLVYQVQKYTPRQCKRLDMRPGITGWAQVNGGELLPWQERIEKDIWYTENHSLKLDLEILCKTVGVVLRGRKAWVEQSQDEIARLPGATHDATEEDYR